MSKNRFSSEMFDTPLHRQWRADRLLRQRVPLYEAWRGCLGLAMLLERPDDTHAYGELALVHNQQLTWLALRDVPVGQFPGSALLNRRDVNYVNTTQARLRYGMPVIDFEQGDLRNAVDFKLMPLAPHLQRVGHHACPRKRITPRPDNLDCHDGRMFAVLNTISALMTHAAFFGVDDDGRAYRRSWAAVRAEEGEPFHPQPPRRWMPRPYLSFPLDLVDHLYWTATRSHAQEWCWECPCCHQVTGLSGFRSRQRAGFEVLDGGDFIADCIGCGRRCTWLLHEAKVWRVRRQFPQAFREGFCHALGHGLSLLTLGPEMYQGAVDVSEAPSSLRPPIDRRNLVGHRLKSEIDGGTRVVFLPTEAQVLVGAGEHLEATSEWARVIPCVPRRWVDREPATRWWHLDEVAGLAMIDHLQQLWFRSQLVRLPADPSQILAPAGLVSVGVQATPPLELWWDTTPVLPYYDWQTQAAVFPPLRLRKWERLAFPLPGDVLLDASIADPRFSIHGTGDRNRGQWRRPSTVAACTSRSVQSSKHRETASSAIASGRAVRLAS